MTEIRKENKLKKVVRKVLEIGAMLSTGIAIVSMLIDYIYIPADLKLLSIITANIGLVLYIVTNVSDLS